MKNLFPLFLFMLALAFNSCSPQVNTTRPTQADLSNYETFAYLPNADVETNRDDVADVNKLIIDKVNQQMKMASYTLDRDNPDLLVLVDTRKDNETRVDRDPVYTTGYNYATYGTPTVSPYYNNYTYNSYGTYRDFVGYDRDYYKVKTGTLVVSIIDRKTGNTVWRGMSSDTIDGRSVDDMRALVANIFEEYPLNQAR